MGASSTRDASGGDLVLASACAPAEIRERELERDRGGVGGTTKRLAGGTIVTAAVLRERERDRGGGWGMSNCAAAECT